MVKDADFELYNNDDQTALAGAALDTDGTAVELGAAGLHRNVQFYFFVEKADANRDLTAKLELTLNNSTWREVGQLTCAAGFKGQQVLNVSRNVPWERYTPSEIKVRVNISSPSNGNAGDWDKVSAGLGYAESESYGRDSDSDDLVDA